MKDTEDLTRSVVVERELPHPPKKVWRALTEPHLVAEWLMANDIAPVLGARFDLTADWGTVACRVTGLEPYQTLAYSWDTKDLRSVVTWSLTATAGGTRLRMEQTGFRPGQENYHRGATMRWPQFVTALDQVVAREADGAASPHSHQSRVAR